MSQPKIQKEWGDKVYIEWIDAIEKTGWQSVENAIKMDDEVFCRTNAFFLSQDKDFIHVAHTIGMSKTNDVTGILRIPKRWLSKVK